MWDVWCVLEAKEMNLEESGVYKETKKVITVSQKTQIWMRVVLSGMCDSIWVHLYK